MNFPIHYHSLMHRIDKFITVKNCRKYQRTLKTMEKKEQIQTEVSSSDIRLANQLRTFES